ncbi:alpha/beta hydrolase [Flavitalea flava]
MKLKQKLALNYIRARINILSLVSVKKAAKKAFDVFCTPLQRSGKKCSPLFEKGEKLSFRMEGITVRGHRWVPHLAPNEQMVPARRVLIVHGFESSSRNFDLYIQGLLQKGYEVLAFDAPAHGESGGKRLTLPFFVKTLENIYEKYGPIQSFMGHSFGGLAVSLLIESLRPHSSTKLVLIAPATETTTAVDAFFSLLHLNQEVRSAFEELVIELSGHPFSYYSIRRVMYLIKADVLWLHDEDDRITPWLDALPVKEDNHPNLRIVMTKGLGHRKIYRDPSVIQQVVEFL